MKCARPDFHTNKKPRGLPGAFYHFFFLRFALDRGFDFDFGPFLALRRLFLLSRIP